MNRDKIEFTVTRYVNGKKVNKEDLKNYTITDPALIDIVYGAIQRHNDLIRAQQDNVTFPL